MCPEWPQVIVADGICQGATGRTLVEWFPAGPRAVFVHCASDRGWLPLTDPSVSIRRRAELLGRVTKCCSGILDG